MNLKPIQEDKKIPDTHKAYLGDGAYARCDGEGVWITAENGEEVTQQVYLEPVAVRSLVRFCERVGMVLK